jgi:hypothetical protein
MPIRSATTNYTGRKKDISILQNPDALISGAQTVEPSFGKLGRFCAGVQKTIQRYAIILLTNLSSQEFYPDFGTSFLSTLNSYTVIDALRARQIFVLASYATVSAMQDYQNNDTTIPADERIVSATLIDIVVSNDSASFSVAIKTAAGDVVDFLLPLPK